MMTPSPTRPAWAACSARRLRQNLGLLSRAVGGKQRVLAVLKAGAYGHGTVETARVLQKAGVASFGVATLDEGVALRQAGIRAEMYLGASGMNAQMKYADRRNAAAAIIVGSNERAEGKITIKDLAAGAEQAKAIKDNAEYKAAKVGQWTADRADLVSELSKIAAVAKMRAGD